MTRVYGSCIEPGGYELDDDASVVACPGCGAYEALERYWETCDGGSLNMNHSIVCTVCDHAEGDLPECWFEPFEDKRSPETEALLDALVEELGY